MLEVYILNVKEPLSKAYETLFLEHIPKERESRMKRFRREADSRRTLMGEILIKQMLSKHLNKPVREIKFLTNEYGKPYLEGNPFYFNVSHSGDWVIGAISDVLVGVDVEMIKEADFGIAQRFYTQGEYDYLCHIKEDGIKNQQFYILWSGKESYIKMIGKGLTIPLDKFELVVDEKKLVLKMPYEEETGYFKIYPIDPKNYSFVVCSKEEIHNVNYRAVDYKELYNALLRG